MPCLRLHLDLGRLCTIIGCVCVYIWCDSGQAVGKICLMVDAGFNVVNEMLVCVCYLGCCLLSICV